MIGHVAMVDDDCKGFLLQQLAVGCFHDDNWFVVVVGLAELSRNYERASRGLFSDYNIIYWLFVIIKLVMKVEHRNRIIKFNC